MYPTDRRYAKDHEWVQLLDGTATLGITDYAQDQLGDIVYVELPEIGLEVNRGDVLGTIESVKAVSEVFAPVSGSVCDVNQDLDGQPEAINGEPHSAGWYCKIQVSEPDEMDDLMDSSGYEAFIETAG